MGIKVLLIESEKTINVSLEQLLISNDYLVDVLEDYNSLDVNKLYDVVIVGLHENTYLQGKHLLEKIKIMYPYSDVLVISYPLSFKECCELVNIGIDGLYDNMDLGLNEHIINKIKELTEPLTDEETYNLLKAISDERKKEG